MSLYNKHRPTSFDEIMGHTHVLKSLKASISDNRAQSYLFAGPSGVGKTTLARLTAQALNCTDIIEIDGATHTGIDHMRRIMDSAAYRSLDGGFKAYIIDECHQLSKQAWQSLLKIIEEPPKHVYWLLCTTESSKIPSTIKTRVLTYVLPPLSTHDLIAIGRKIIVSEDFKINDKMLNTIVLHSDGSPRQLIVNIEKCSHAVTCDDVVMSLEQVAASATAIDLSRFIFSDQFELAKSKKMLLQLKNENVESIRITVFSYATSVALNNPSTWALMVMSEFESPCVETNRMGDILLRLSRLHYRKHKTGAVYNERH